MRKKLHFLVILLLLLLQAGSLHANALQAQAISPPAPKTEPVAPQKNRSQIIAGTCYATYQTPYTFLTAKSDAELLRLKQLGLNTISLRGAWSQEAYNTWDIAPNFATASDEAISHVVRECHRLGMKVMISLMVDFADDNRGGKWRW